MQNGGGKEKPDHRNSRPTAFAISSLRRLSVLFSQFPSTINSDNGHYPRQVSKAWEAMAAGNRSEQRKDKSWTHKLPRTRFSLPPLTDIWLHI